MKRRTTGTRKTDGPNHVVMRGVRAGDVLPSVLGGIGWLGFVLALLRCVVRITTP